MSRLILPAFTLLALLFCAPGVRADDDLDRFKVRQKVAIDKLKKDAALAIDRSRTLEKTDPAEARNIVQSALRQISSSLDLSESDRLSLVRQLQTRSDQIDQAIRSQRIAQEQKYLREQPSKYRPTVDPPGSGGVSGVAKDFRDSAKGAQQTHADLIRQREKNLLALNMGIEKSHVPNDKEINFPPYWKELTERRKELVSQKLTAQEVKLLKTLNSTMSVKYDGDKFKAVLQHLEERTGLSLIVDPQSERDLNLDYDDPITIKMDKVSVRTALKTILGQKQLTYIIKEGNIQVMTPKRASEHTVVRTYPVDDLIQPNQMAMMFGPFVAQAQMMQNAQQLINLIMMSVEPTHWQPNGPGTIVFYPPTRSLIVRASAEMHYQMASPGLFGR